MTFAHGRRPPYADGGKLKFILKVVDDEGKPVEGATVEVHQVALAWEDDAEESAWRVWRNGELYVSLWKEAWRQILSIAQV